jgi:hypothetical protein
MTYEPGWYWFPPRQRSTYSQKKGDNVPTKSRQKKLAILDVDGSLSDHQHRLPYISGTARKDRENWETFYALQYTDVPYEPAILAAKAWQKEYVVAIFTGRPEEYRTDTMVWLKNQGIRVDFLYMRPRGDKQTMVDLKLGWLDQVNDQGWEVAVVLEDHPGVVEAFRERGLFVMQPTNHWIEYKGTEAHNGTGSPEGSEQVGSLPSGSDSQD